MLILPIKKLWFDMILSGKKKEEYREIKPYYESRLPKNFGYFLSNGELQSAYIFDSASQSNKEAIHEVDVMFRNGYSKNSPSFIAKCSLSIGVGKEKWGAQKDVQYFILTVKEIIK